MKPKNRIYCRGCGRLKILFESEAEANLFIRYNKEDIEGTTGKSPVRSYYCEFCAGWHTTSVKSKILGERIDLKEKRFVERAISKKDSEKLVEDIQDLIFQKYEDIKTRMYFEDIEECLQEINKCKNTIDEILRLHYTISRYHSLQKGLNVIEEELHVIKLISSLTDQERRDILNSNDTSEEGKLFNDVIKRFQFIDEYRLLQIKLAEMLAMKNFEEFDNSLELFLKENVEEEKGSYKNRIIPYIMRELKELKRKRKMDYLRYQRKLEKKKKEGNRL